jgi:hypothetical protein
MKRLLPAFLLLCACASNPGSWRPSEFNPPAGAPLDFWAFCYGWGQDAVIKAAGYDKWMKLSPEEKECLRLSATALCLRNAHLKVMASGDRLAIAQWGNYEQQLEDGLKDACSPDGGGTPRVMRAVAKMNQAASAGTFACPMPN